MPTVASVGRLRSLLFVPSVRPDRFAKAVESGADAVVVDLEDATPSDRKAEGRAAIRVSLPDLAAGAAALLVRVNTLASGLQEADVRDGLVGGLAGVLVPKVERLDELERVAAFLDAAGHAGLGVVAGIETARGVADARQLLAHPRVVGAYFGAEDFIADLGGVRTPGGAEVLHARSETVLAARLAGVWALDQIVTDFRDDERFVADAAMARSLGYRGKLCIHPAQVALANRAFVPDEAEVARARRLIEAHERATAAGQGAVAVDGQMVDEPLIRQARQVLAAAGRDEPKTAGPGLSPDR